MRTRTWKQLYNILLLSRFSHVWLCAGPWTAAYQAPPSMGFSRQKFWSGVPLPSLAICIEDMIFKVTLNNLEMSAIVSSVFLLVSREKDFSNWELLEESWVLWLWRMSHSCYFLNKSLKIFIFMYLTVSDLSCSTWDLYHHMWDLVHWTGLEPGPLALGAWGLSYQTTREVPQGWV